MSELSLVGLNELESVVIGERSFKAVSGDYPKSSVPGRRFQLKDCPKLRTVRIGSQSFADYSACEIENVNALEMIVVGKYSFFWSSLELRGGGGVLR